jgi:hypothetical protein
LALVPFHETAGFACYDDGRLWPRVEKVMEDFAADEPRCPRLGHRSRLILPPQRFSVGLQSIRFPYDAATSDSSSALKPSVNTFTGTALLFSLPLYTLPRVVVFEVKFQGSLLVKGGHGVAFVSHPQWICYESPDSNLTAGFGRTSRVELTSCTPGNKGPDVEAKYSVSRN